MHIQFTVYENDDIAFVQTMSRARKVPDVGTVVQFPEGEDSRYCRILDIVWRLYLDADPIVEIICEVCIDPRCHDSRASQKEHLT